MIYGYILKAERRVQRIRRRFARMLPMWIKDVLGTLKYFNFLALEPTVCAIFFAPWHFYEKLPRSIEGKSRFLTPVKTLTTFSTLIVLLAKRLSPARFSSLHFQFIWVLVLLIGAASAPVWGLLFAVIAQSVKRTNIGQILPFDNSEELLLSGRAWGHLRTGMYLQGLLYFAVYFVVYALPVVLLLNGALIYSGAFFGEVSEGDLSGEVSILRLFAALIFVIMGLSMSWFVNRPLAALFRNCLRFPTFEAYSIDLRPLKVTMEKAFASSMKQLESESIREEWGKAAARMRRDEERTAAADSAHLSALLFDRAKACREVEGLRFWLDEAQDKHLLEIFDLALHGALISPTLREASCAQRT